MTHLRILALSGLVPAAAALGQPVAFYDLGPQLSVWASNPIGDRVVGNWVTGPAFQWTAVAGVTTLMGQGGAPLSGQPFVISSDDSTVAGIAFSSPTDKVFKITPAGYELVGAPPATNGPLDVEGISGDGSVMLCSAQVAGQYQVFLHTAASGFQPIAPSTSTFQWGNGMTPGSSIVVGTSANRAFQWVAHAGIQYLDGPWNGITFRQAFGITDDGSVLVGRGRSAAGISHAVRFSGGVLQDLGDLPGGADDSTAYAISSDGRVIVGLGNGSNNGFIWDSVNGMRDLRAVLMQLGVTSLTGWPKLGVQGISRNAQTVFGTGIAPDGVWHGWVARFAPCGYANCDGSTSTPALNVADFTCFLTQFASGCSNPSTCYANCDGSTALPFLNVADFTCFLTRYASGCE